VSLELIVIEENRGDEVLAVLGAHAHGPVLLRRSHDFVRKLNGLHHLPGGPIGEDENGIAVLVGKIEGQNRMIGHLLN
jgi:hypothetical protein